MYIYLLKVLYKSIPCFWIQVNRKNSETQATTTATLKQHFQLIDFQKSIFSWHYSHTLDKQLNAIKKFNGFFYTPPSQIYIYIFFLIIIYLFIYLFLAALGFFRFCARAFSSCGKRGPLLIAVRGPLTIAASLVAEHRLQTRRLSSCGSRGQLLRGTWDPPRPGLEPVSPALAGRLSTTAPPGKPPNIYIFQHVFELQPVKFLKKISWGGGERWSLHFFLPICMGRHFADSLLEHS